jgi:hypothetical protein
MNNPYIDLFWLMTVACLLGYIFLALSKKTPERGKNESLTMLLRLAALSTAVGALTLGNKQTVLVLGFVTAVVWVIDAMRRVPRVHS